ncbi:hypothetical protein DFH07DRAFT_1023351 [Mycena maculata]|uniref:TERF2-interacting telomeric protein 1 Myb domain-containing protein n=1 Tax=Mycena maculata TaxID=230809 RepID=A0AAD7NGD4_9AGAR|nr:hypothetical protein DFH07DRAFT_1023351 [Mycena maculata]
MDAEPPFTRDEDKHLVKFISAHGVHTVDRRGSKLYAVLGPEASDEFAWSRKHPAKSWRDRYTASVSKVDAVVTQYERKMMQPARLPTTPPPIKTLGAKAHDTGRYGSVSVDSRAPPAPLGPPVHQASRLSVESSQICKYASHVSMSQGQSQVDSSSPLSTPTPAPKRRSQPVSSTIPVAPSSAVTSTLEIAHAVHKKLAKTARKTMFSIDFAWAVYAQLGSVEATRAALRQMADAVDEALQNTTDGQSAGEDTDHDDEIADNGKRKGGAISETKSPKKRKI